MTLLPTKRLGDLILEAKPGFACGEEAEDGIFQIRMNNITRNGRLDLSKRRLVPAHRPGLSDFLVKQGDILFNATNSPDMVGKTAMVRATSEPTVFSNHFLRLRVDPSTLSPAYLSRWLQLQFERGTFRAVCRQWVNQATVDRNALLRLAVPLPALSHQQRVTAVLDRVDELRAKRREALAHLDDLTQSIFLDMFGDPASNPHRIPVDRIGNLTPVGTGSTPRRDSADNYGGRIPWVKTAEVNGGHITDTEERITEAGRRSARCRVYPPKSILIALYGQGRTRGQCAILGIEATTNQACAVLPPSDRFNSTFMFCQLQLSYERLRSLGRGGNQANLNLGLVSNFDVLLPPLPAQEEFARKIASLDALRHQQLAGLADLDALFASLQDRAFRGLL